MTRPEEVHFKFQKQKKPIAPWLYDINNFIPRKWYEQVGQIWQRFSQNFYHKRHSTIETLLLKL